MPRSPGDGTTTGGSWIVMPIASGGGISTRVNAGGFGATGTGAGRLATGGAVRTGFGAGGYGE